MYSIHKQKNALVIILFFRMNQLFSYTQNDFNMDIDIPDYGKGNYL